MPDHNEHETRVIPRDRARSAEGANVARLGELRDYQVADGEADVRGWHVLTRDGRRAGEVHDLVVDPYAMKACYLEVELDKDALRLRKSRRVLVPAAAVWLNDDEEIVRLGVTASELMAIPSYDRLSFSRADADVLRRRYGRYLTLSSDEGLALGGRRRPTGRIEIRKRDATEHVEKSVTRQVTVERPAGGDDQQVQDAETVLPVRNQEVVAADAPRPSGRSLSRHTTTTED
jgi:hypothetical protein